MLELAFVNKSLLLQHALICSIQNITIEEQKVLRSNRSILFPLTGRVVQTIMKFTGCTLKHIHKFERIITVKHRTSD